MSFKCVFWIATCLIAHLPSVYLLEVNLNHTYCPSYCHINSEVELKEGEAISFIGGNPAAVKRFHIEKKIKLQSIPYGIFETFVELEELTISSNQISVIQSDRFKDAKKLRMLNLYRNKIQVLSTRAFADLTNVEELHFGENEIETIEDNTFDGLVKLIRINLVRNQIRELGRFTFAGAPNIQILRLTWNRIETIEDGALNLPKLKELSLENNMLTILSDNILIGASNLERANFDTNKITHIGEAFDGCHKLKRLYLVDNPIEDVNLTTLATLENLSELNLANTSFQLPEELPLSAPTLSKLRVITLTNNGLSSPDLLKHLSVFGKLESISAGGNRFTGINNIEDIAKQFPLLRNFDLEYNEPPLCDWISNNSRWFGNINVKGNFAIPDNWIELNIKYRQLFCSTVQ